VNTGTSTWQSAGLDQSDLIQFAGDLADVSGAVIRAHFRRHIAVEHKSDRSPVTAADRVTESALRAMITERYPEHGIIGEEHGRERAQSRFQWVIDPIDGTKAFITGLPTFGTLIAFLVDRRPILGVVDMPALGERWIGAHGEATCLGARPCRTSECTALSAASLFATTPAMFGEQERERFEALSTRVSITRFGADCYAYGLLASGFADLVVEADMSPYDYLAAVPVIEGAGGIITDWEGRSIDLDSGPRVVAAANASLHAAAMAVISPRRSEL